MTASLRLVVRQPNHLLFMIILLQRLSCSRNPLRATRSSVVVTAAAPSTAPPTAARAPASSVSPVVSSRVHAAASTSLRLVLSLLLLDDLDDLIWHPQVLDLRIVSLQ